MIGEAEGARLEEAEKELSEEIVREREATATGGVSAECEKEEDGVQSVVRQAGGAHGVRQEMGQWFRFEGEGEEARSVVEEARVAEVVGPSEAELLRFFRAAFEKLEEVKLDLANTHLSQASCLTHSPHRTRNFSHANVIAVIRASTGCFKW